MRQAAEDTPGEKPWGAAEWLLLLVLAAVQFTHALDFMIMMPLGPRYLRELDISPRDFSLLVSAYAFSACLAGLLAASLIDRFDRKTALLFLGSGFTLGTLLCAIAPGYTSLLIGRCVAGAFGGILGALNLAIIGDAFPENRRGLATGVLMSAFSLATIIGIPAGLELARYLGTWAPFGVLAGLSAAAMVLAALVLKPLRKHLVGGHNLLKTSPWIVLSHPNHVRAYLLMICIVLGMFTIVPHLATFLAINVGLGEANLPTMYLCGGLGTLATMSYFGRLADRVGKLPVFRIMAALTTVVLLVLTNLSRTPVVLTIAITTVFMVVGSGRMVPAMALITSSSLPAYRGSFMSIISSVQQAAFGLASLVAGVILTQPVKEGPLVGFPIVGLLACATTLASIWVAGYVRPVVETPPGKEPTPEPAATTGAETGILTEPAAVGVMAVSEAIQGTP